MITRTMARLRILLVLLPLFATVASARNGHEAKFSVFSDALKIEPADKMTEPQIAAKVREYVFE